MRRSFLILAVLSISVWAQPEQPAQAPIPVKVVEMPPTPPTPRRDFLGYLQSLGPLIAACVALYIGFTQRRLQRQQLKQNLFEKRFAVYEAIKSYLGDSTIRRPTLVRHLLKFPMKAEATFLFGSDMAAFCAELDAMVMKYDLAFSRCCETDPESGERKLRKRTNETKNLFQEMRLAREPIGKPMIDRLEQLCRPYLQIQSSPVPWYARLESYLEQIADCNEKRLKTRYEQPST